MVAVLCEDVDPSAGRRGGLVAVSKPVDDAGEEPVLERARAQSVSRPGLSLQSPRRDTPVDPGCVQRFHFVAVTVVPSPRRERIFTSSMRRRTPGRPSPRFPDVEYPACRALSTFAIPGPLS